MKYSRMDRELLKRKITQQNGARDFKRPPALVEPKSSVVQPVTEIAAYVELCQQCSCDKCKDIMVGPSMLPCTCTFCFECIQSHMEEQKTRSSGHERSSASANSLYNMDEMSLACPKCHMLFKENDMKFATTMNDTIVGKITNLEQIAGKDSYGLEEWRRKNDIYIKNNGNRNCCDNNGGGCGGGGNPFSFEMVGFVVGMLVVAVGAIAFFSFRRAK